MIVIKEMMKVKYKFKYNIYYNKMSQKILWSSVSIKVPSEFITVDSKGKVKICPPLTKSGGLSRRNKKPSINIVTDDKINKIQIQNEGEYKIKPDKYTKKEIKENHSMGKEDNNKAETIHERMARLRAMRKSNKKELDGMASEDINRVGTDKERIKDREIRRKKRGPPPNIKWTQEDEDLYKKVHGESSGLKIFTFY
jgi:hypothetical protein